MDLREVGYGGSDWINLSQERMTAGLCEGGNEPPGSLKAISPEKETALRSEIEEASSVGQNHGYPRIRTSDVGELYSQRLRWAGHVARMGESRNAYRVLIGRPEEIRSLGWPRRRWEDNIKMDLREMGYDNRDWINLAQDRDRWRAYVRAAMNLRVS
ncbi:hypothetical protein ANN_17034 [Periplaneta americana]|uniref:Uncharacterized protein n=1 Tax=Periplaneta americana TaxID=6978 RepID=A0ABQ8SRS4_PERAM|nr:hypothetical protein ANN_17034 [Periplaneta americana]